MSNQTMDQFRRAQGPITKNDARPVIGSFLATAKRHGFKPVEVIDVVGERFDLDYIHKNDRENTFTRTGWVRDHAGSGDDFSVRFEHTSGVQIVAAFILCNDPEEVVADWSVRVSSWIGEKRREVDEAFSKAVWEFCDRWSDKSWPKRRQIWVGGSEGYVDIK